MAERAHPEDPGFRDRWFGLKKNPYRQKLYERYELCKPLLAGKIVLDVPCGTGWGTALLSGYRFAWGVDIAEDAIAYAKGRYEKPGVLEFKVGNMEHIPLDDDSVDVLLCLEGFEHVSEAVGAAFIEEAKRVLRRSGTLVMTCPVLDERGSDTGNPHHLCEYPEEQLISILNQNFRILNLERIRGPEGPEYRATCENFKARRYDPK
jgi:ubiquinone/menaquinone biosynthesis C-methylase UbiE